MSERSIELARLAAQDREKRIAKWIREGHQGEGGDLERWVGVVMWGVFIDAGNDGAPKLPVAIFDTEDKANAFITVSEYSEACALPVVVDLAVRDNFEVPR